MSDIEEQTVAAQLVLDRTTSENTQHLDMETFPNNFRGK
jgi:hypothetical protein